MDFRRVEARFRPLALFVQVSLLAALVAYLAYQVIGIAAAEKEPPTSVDWKVWKTGAGIWAICSTSGSELVEVGMGLGTDFISGAVLDPERAGWTLSAKNLQIDGHQRNCSIVDLSGWDLPPQSPSGFNFCCGGTLGCDVFVWSMDEWQQFYVVRQNTLEFVQASMMARVAKNGSATDVITSQYLDGFQTSSQYKLGHCPYLSPLTSAVPGFGILRVVLKTDGGFIMTVRVLDVDHQLWDLVGKVGGYLTVLTLLFNICFVKKWPDSGVAQIYEERTFISERIGSSQSRANVAPVPMNVPPGMYGRESE